MAFGVRFGHNPARSRKLRAGQKPHRADDVIDVEFTEVPRDQRSGASNAKRADTPWGKPQ